MHIKCNKHKCSSQPKNIRPRPSVVACALHSTGAGLIQPAAIPSKMVINTREKIRTADYRLLLWPLKHVFGKCTCYTASSTVACVFLSFHVQDFDLSWSPILKALFRSSVTGSEELGWDHVASESASAPPSCYCANHFLLNQAVPFTKCGCLFSCFTERKSTEIRKK